jgi:hypothetical protein
MINELKIIENSLFKLDSTENYLFMPLSSYIKIIYCFKIIYVSNDWSILLKQYVDWHDVNNEFWHQFNRNKE